MANKEKALEEALRTQQLMDAIGRRMILHPESEGFATPYIKKSRAYVADLTRKVGGRAVDRIKSEVPLFPAIDTVVEMERRALPRPEVGQFPVPRGERAPRPRVQSPIIEEQGGATITRWPARPDQLNPRPDEREFDALEQWLVDRGRRSAPRERPPMYGPKHEFLRRLLERGDRELVVDKYGRSLQ